MGTEIKAPGDHRSDKKKGGRQQNLPRRSTYWRDNRVHARRRDGLLSSAAWLRRGRSCNCSLFVFVVLAGMHYDAPA